MLKCMVIDDEPLATKLLEDHIAKVSFLQLASSFNNPMVALISFNSNPVDLIFLDIQMPHTNGFELLEKLPNKNFKIIFTTAYNEYAIQAIRFSAFDYLLKPIDSDELQASVHRFLESQENYQQQLDLLKRKQILSLLLPPLCWKTNPLFYRLFKLLTFLYCRALLLHRYKKNFTICATEPIFPMKEKPFLM